MSEPPRDDIDRRLEAWYGDREPSAATMAKARALIDRPRSRGRGVAVAAAAVLVAIISLVWWINRDTTFAPTAEAAAAEIAKNHLKGRGPEFAADQIERLADAMKKRLGFEPVTPVRFRDRWEFTVQGGRYCSVDGAIAAQVACLRPDGQRMTLYLWLADEDVPYTWYSDHNVGETLVTIWREGKLLAGLAEPR